MFLYRPNWLRNKPKLKSHKTDMSLTASNQPIKNHNMENFVLFFVECRGHDIDVIGETSEKAKRRNK